MKWFYFFIGCGFTLTILYIIGSNSKLMNKLKEQEIKLIEKKQSIIDNQQNKLLEYAISIASGCLEEYDIVFQSLIDKDILHVQDGFKSKTRSEWTDSLIKEAIKQIETENKNGK